MSQKKGPLEDEWKRKIEVSTLNDFFWKAKIVMIESAGSEQDRIYLSKFEEIAAEDKRFVIKNISKTETMFMINQLGTEKKVKDDSFRIFEECQMFLKDKLEIPSYMIALAIKHLMLKLKQDYQIIQRQRLLVKEGLQRESMTMINTVEIKNIRDIQTKFDEPEKDNKSKKRKDVESSINIALDIEKKYNTQLRTRGEEWRDKTYVNDFPTDGPNLYIAVTGFQDPFLAENLIKLGIPLTAIIQIRIDLAAASVPSTLTRPSKRGQDQADTLTEKSQQFWEELQFRRVLRESSGILKDTAFIVFSPPYWEKTTLSGKAEKIYDEVCYLLYDVQVLSRQHLNYLKCINIVHIPIDSSNNNLFNLYKKLADESPTEYICVFTLLGTMLQVVSDMYDNIDIKLTRCSSTSASLVKSTSKTRETSNKIDQAQNITENVFEELINLNQSKTYRPTIGDEFENYKEPIVINYGDFAKIKTFHYNNINIESLVRTMLLGSPLHSLWNHTPKPEHDIEIKISFHINLLISCFKRKDIISSELIRMINFLACRKLYNNRSSKLKNHIPETSIKEFKKKYLKRSVLVEPFTKHVLQNTSDSPRKSHESNYFPSKSIDDSQNKYPLFQCPDITELVSVSEIDSNTQNNHLINEYDYFEDYTGNSSFQILNNFFYKYNCVDYKYCEVTDSIILMFFNSYDKNGVDRIEWKEHLSTPVCLQDFFDFVFEEKYDWIKDQEKKYDEMMNLRNKSEYSDVADIIATTSCTDHAVDPGPDLLIEGSLKHSEYIETMVEESDNLTEIKSSSKKSLKKSTVTSHISSKKKTTATSTPKSAFNQSSIQSSNTDLDSSIKLFSAYFGGCDRRIEILGKIANFYSKDGTRVSTDYYITIPENREFVSLKIFPGNNDNVITLHRALGDFSRAHYGDKHESFRITCKNDVVINIVKQINNIVSSEGSFSDSKSKRLSIDDLNNKLDYEIYHKICITWPNNLIIESIHDETNSEITHIKQHFIKPPTSSDEDMRCINLFGEVIILKSNGHIEVLRPDGSFIYITKCKKISTYDNSEKTNISTPSISNLKTKQKSTKSSEKSTKSSEKSPKVESGILSTPKLLLQDRYKLIIEDYYVINSYGLKETYINGILDNTQKLLVRTATDYNLPEIFFRRMDNTDLLINKDGIQILTFYDNTRIISTFFIEDNEIYPEWSDEERENFGFDNCMDSGYVSVLIRYTIEKSNFATVSVNPSDKRITIDSPNNINVNVCQKDFNIKLNKDTCVSFDGYTMNIGYEPCQRCLLKMQCEVNIIKEKEINDDFNQYNTTYWLKMIDAFGKKILVTESGDLNVTDSNENEVPSNVCPCNKQTITKHVCNYYSTAEHQKFFILRRDLTSSQLMHREIIENLKNSNQMDPWFSINTFDTFGDHRKALSVLSPIYLNEDEKWLMESKFANKPKYLTYEDLRKVEGKGFYHWMRPYDRFEPKPRKPVNAVSPHLPKAFILRTFEQQWSQENREQLKGANELIEAILHYRNILETDYLDTINLHINDPRTDDKKKTDEMVQNIAHKIYTDLEKRLVQNIYENMKTDITTKRDDIFENVDKENEFINKEKVTHTHSDMENHVIEFEKAVPLSPNLERYWRIRAAEIEKEKYYRNLLREDKVEPYFNNIMGGAIWWEVANITNKVADVAEADKKSSQ